MPYKELKERGNIVIWGTGRTLEKYFKRIDPNIELIGFCDSDEKKWGSEIVEGLCCFSKDSLETGHNVIIAIQNSKAIEEVIKELEEKGINYCHITEAVEVYKSVWETKEIEKYKKIWVDIGEYSKNVVKFINCHVPYKFCNLKCEYCYVRQVREFEQSKLILHSPEFIRFALSKKRLGGTAFINFCAGGETLFVKDLIPIIRALQEEGHYIQIVTNGTITSAFNELLSASVNLNHLFIKFSFHYLELKRLGLLNQFRENVWLMKNAGCSVSVELVASDSLVPYIYEIKEYSYKSFGTLPHVTVARNDKTEGIDILTKLSFEEYYNIWSQFDSKLFEFKVNQVGKKQKKFCMAGKWSFQMNLETGNIDKCVGNPFLDNIYEDICRPINFSAVGTKCLLPYCYNCHAYLAFGLVEEEDAPTYFEVRDKELKNGEHWITKEMKKAISIKLYDTNNENSILQ